MTERYETYRYHHPLRATLVATVAAVLLLLCARTGMAGTPGSPFGRHFIFAFPDTAQHIAPVGTPLKPQTTIVMFSLDTAKVTINGPRLQRTIIVLPGTSQVVIPSPTLTWMTNQILQGATYDVTADHDVAIYCYYATAYGSEAFRPLPIESWGDEYYVAALTEEELTHIRYSQAEESLAFSRAPGEIVIVASEYTQVHVDYPASFRSKDADLVLGAGDMVVLESFDTAYTFEDFSGTRITSTRPIGVLSGNTRSMGGGVLDVGVEITSPLLNAAIEWLPPASGWGTKFAYRQLSPADGTKMRELVRVYACSPGTTTVRDARDGTVRTLQQGEFAEYESSIWTNPVVVPFELTASQPAQAMVVSGPYSEPTDPGAIVPYSFYLWGIAMSELVPHEKWVNYGRFYSPAYPALLQHYVTIIADPGATLWLDGTQVTLDATFPRFGYQQAEIGVNPGDHSIVSRGGLFSAIAYGEAQGFEEYKPVAARKKKAPTPLSPHPSAYTDRTVVSYAYPVSGVVTAGVDSLTISIAESCDSTIAVAVRPSGAWDLSPFVIAQLDPASVNTAAVIVPILEFQQTTGYRIRFTPVNPNIDASGKVVIVNAAGKRWEIPFHYTPQVLVVTPSPLDITGVPSNIRQFLSLMLKNGGAASISVRSARLKSGANGFSLPDLSGLPRLLASSDELKLPVDFVGLLSGTTYRDTLIIQTACKQILIPLSARTNDAILGPDPHIGGYDWRERWLTTLNPCTKSGITGYETVVTLSNNGGTRFTVVSLTLVGADADSNYFQLGAQPTVQPGDTVGAGAGLPIKVIFRPASERAYHCRIRLITADGDTVEADLDGIGIESHVVIGDHDFGRIEYLSGMVGGSVDLQALPTRPLEVRGLRIAGADRTDFGFDPTAALPDENVPATWWHLQPGDKRTVPLMFAAASPGAKSAWIEVIGDQSTCDDSTGALTGSSFLAGAASPPVDLGSAGGCRGLTGTVSLRNIGGIPLQIVAIDLLDNIDVMALDTVALPVALAADSVFGVNIRFTPLAVGAVTARVRFVVERMDGSNQFDTVMTTVTARATPLTATAHIARDYHAAPGAHVTVPVVLEAPLDSARIDELVVKVPRLTHVTIADATAGDLAAMLAGTILAGWTITIDAGSPDTVRLHLHAPPRTYLRGAGDLLRLPLGTFLRDSMASELPFSVEAVGRACTAIDAHTGRLALDSLCGLSLRLIELSKANYALDGNRPNPFNPTTEIFFTIGLDGNVSLVVYDAAGREVAKLVDGYLASGRYGIVWDAGTFPSGIYRYTIHSGDWSREGVMVLSK